MTSDVYEIGHEEEPTWASDLYPVRFKAKLTVRVPVDKGVRLEEVRAISVDAAKWGWIFRNSLNEIPLEDSEWIGRWLELRRKRRIPSGGPLFCTLAGGPLDQSYIRHLLPRLARRAGIERRVHAHGLRHAFAVDMVRAGAPLYIVRDALGHASVATTQVYLSRVGAHEAVDAMRNRHWSPE